jgi:hypothetical protein
MAQQNNTDGMPLISLNTMLSCRLTQKKGCTTLVATNAENVNASELWTAPKLQLLMDNVWIAEMRMKHEGMI